MSVRTDAPHRMRDDVRRRERALDEALADTFPASDPVAIGAPTGTEPAAAPVDRRSALAAPRRLRRPSG